MQDETMLQRFQKFKSMILSSDIPGNLLLELAESYMTSGNTPTAEAVPVLEGQMSLLEAAA
jgi:hypothetical protein